MDVYVIAGPNGVGKTTFASRFLPEYADCRNFINADLIAKGLSPFSPEVAAVKAGKLVLKEFDDYVRRGKSFGFETTLAGRSYLKRIHRLRKKGYRVHLFFLYVDAEEIAAGRIRSRVMKGGHNIPASVQRRRFGRSIRNFVQYYRPLAHFWYLFNNSGTTPELMASGTERGLRIIDAARYSALMAHYG